MIRVLVALLVCFSATCSHAQSFKWARGGGSTEGLASAPENEMVKHMCTDPHGNVYALSVVGGRSSFPISADTFYRSGAYGNNQNILLTSHDCNGNMRWAKLIGASNGNKPYGITSDNIGHIYVTGRYAHLGGSVHTLFVGYDTAISGDLYLANGLIQFDTLGNFNWIRFVGDNTFSSLSAMGEKESPIAIDGSNNAHFFCYMKSGVILSSTVTSTYGVYDMAYAPAGTLISAARLDLDSQWFLWGAAIDPATNKLYVCGEVNQSMHAGITDTFFAAAFDADRDKLWMHFVGKGNDNGIYGGVMDKNKHIHFTGGAQRHSSTPATTFFYNGDSVVNTHFPTYNLAVILTVDTNGNPVRIKKFDGNSNINYFISVTTLPNDKVAAIGTFGGIAIDGTDTVESTIGEAQNPLFVVVDSANNVHKLCELRGNGFYDRGSAITSDRIGNVYIGGQVEDSVWVDGVPAYHSYGGNTDFFIMKYGVDCDCTAMPVAAFALSGTSTPTVTGTFSGSMSGIDSIRWDFGDGATATTPAHTHTYTSSGTYRICLNLYSRCGNDRRCQDVTVLVIDGVATITGNSNLQVFPNPAREELFIKGLTSPATYRLSGVTGSVLSSGTITPTTNTITLKHLPPAMYLLELTTADGMRQVARVVKE